MSLLGAFQDPQFRKDVVRGLLDAGNRGAVGGLLGAPVDMVAMALRPLGYNVEQPVGGSEWIGQKMQNAGLVSPERNRLAEALAGVAVPAAANRLAPSLFAAEQKAAQNLAAQAPMNRAMRNQAGAIVWHGSPHKFDKFDSSKIGSATDDGRLGAAHYFSTDPSVPIAYANAYKVDVEPKNPLKISMPNWRTDKKDLVIEALGLPKNASAAEITKAAKEKGFDSVMLDYSPAGYKHQEIAMFPGQEDVLRILERNGQPLP